MHRVCQPYAFVHTCEDVHQNLCTLVEADLGLSPVPAIVIGTTYTAFCPQFLYLECQALVLVTFIVPCLQVVRFWNSNVYEINWYRRLSVLAGMSNGLVC